jgi:hypothetical protein
MGYTHYFAYDPNAASFIRAWPGIVSDAKVIAWYAQRVLGVRLSDGSGEGRPVFSDHRICFNGPATDLLANEAFLIDSMLLRAWNQHSGPDGSRTLEQARELGTRNFITSFCKTARKPYDIAVTSILLRARHLAPDAWVLASDGDWEHEWQHGVMYWEPGCDVGPAPVDVVRRLFGQPETRARDPLAAGMDRATIDARRSRG